MERLRELARARDWLAAMRPLPPDVLEELRHRYEVRFTYHSTAIEGNTLTQSETQIGLEKGVTVGGKPLRDHLEAIGHKEALDFATDLATGEEPIGDRQLREIHSLVMKGQDGGGYRQLDVKAAGTDFVYPSWMHLPSHMADFASTETCTRRHGERERPERFAFVECSTPRSRTTSPGCRLRRSYELVRSFDSRQAIGSAGSLFWLAQDDAVLQGSDYEMISD